jgi:hypothetical protein
MTQEQLDRITLQTARDRVWANAVTTSVGMICLTAITIVILVR